MKDVWGWVKYEKSKTDCVMLTVVLALTAVLASGCEVLPAARMTAGTILKRE